MDKHVIVYIVTVCIYIYLCIYMILFFKNTVNIGKILVRTLKSTAIKICFYNF